MKFIKKNKLLMLVIVIFTIFIVIISYLYNIFFGGSKAVYGNRLDGIGAVKITETQFAGLTTKLRENEKVINVKTDLKGKVVNIIITVKDETTKADAKTIGNSTLTGFEKEQLEYYDIQVFVKKDNAELNDFPIIGYKHNSKEAFSWSRDRQVTKDED